MPKRQMKVAKGGKVNSHILSEMLWTVRYVMVMFILFLITQT